MKKAGTLNKYFKTALRCWKFEDEILSPAAYRVVDEIIDLTGRTDALSRGMLYHIKKEAAATGLWPIKENYPIELIVKARLKGITSAIQD